MKLIAQAVKMKCVTTVVTVLSAVALTPWLAAEMAPEISAPPLAGVFARLEPHFHQPAGSPSTGLKRAQGSYAGEGFDVGKPEMVMPTGAGRLSAMVGYGDRIELALSTTEYFNGITDNKSGTAGNHLNPLLSPGRISIQLSKASAKDLRRFDQWIDFARGAVWIELETQDGKVSVEVCGDMAQDNLIISVRDDRRNKGEAVVRYENWRNSTAVTCADGMLTAMESADTSGVSGWKAQSMSLALQVGCVNGAGFPATCSGGAGDITVPEKNAGNFVVVIAVKCAHGRPPVADARSSWMRSASVSPLERERAALEWWSAFWAPAWLDIHGPDADYLARLWYTTLYSYACVGEGPVPPKFNGGPGLVFKDARSWGDGYWWQNQREISFWPMAAAGHPEFTRRSILFFNYAFDRSRDAAKRFNLPGLLFGEGHKPCEWSAPYGEYRWRENKLGAFNGDHADAQAALASRESAKAGYNVLNFVGGLEFVQAIFDYVQYTGDTEIEKTAGAWLKGEARMCLGLLTEEADGLYHIRCADATEQWWKVDDPAPLLAGVRYILTMTVRHGKALGLEDALTAAAGDRLAKLCPLPTVDSWSYKAGKPGNFWYCPTENVAPGGALLAPFRMADGVQSHNSENPELYAVFPFGLFDLNSDGADLAKARSTFDHRFFRNSAGWSQDPVQAARLGLPNTCEVILDHAKKHQKWPYGGWNSPGFPLYPGSSVGEVPYFDGAGVNMMALQESLLQSHASVGDSEISGGGVIRLLPAVRNSWSGCFQLHARGGFIAVVRFRAGQVEVAEFKATRDARLQVLNPFRATAVWTTSGKRVTTDKTIALDLKSGDEVVLVESRNG